MLDKYMGELNGEGSCINDNMRDYRILGFRKYDMEEKYAEDPEGLVHEVEAVNEHALVVQQDHKAR